MSKQSCWARTRAYLSDVRWAVGPRRGVEHTGIRGVPRWFNRVWELCEARCHEEGNPAPAAVATELKREMHRTIQKATEDIEDFQFNTMIAALMTFTNTLSRIESDSPERRAALSGATRMTLLLLLAPIAPHLTEELWEMTVGRIQSISRRGRSTTSR